MMKQQQSYCFETRSSSFFSPSMMAPIPSIQQETPEQLKSEYRRDYNDPKTEEFASLLLSMKHSRSVSPDPQDITISRFPASEQTDEPSRRLVYDTDTSDFQSSPSYSSSDNAESSSVPPSPLPSATTTSKTDDYNWASLLGGSALVKIEDRDLVPDALFVAMAQMQVCHLVQADRVGCYKTRELGFLGMCCKHCEGQPGFGRYYPNSVRSLAQTTTSQTILKHIGSKCNFTPPHVRAAVLSLQREQAAEEGLVSGRPRYGSRKVFFQRIWSRLHGKVVGTDSTDDDMGSKTSSSNSTSHSDCDDGSLMSGHSELEQHIENNKRKNPRTLLPLVKNKRIKVIGSSYEV